MQELACYLKGLVTSQASNWMERIREWARWILEKPIAPWDARDSVLRAVWKARNLIHNLHGDYLYGNDLQHAEKLHDVLVVLEDADVLVVLGDAEAILKVLKKQR